jgi:AbiTii-like protein
VLHTLPYKQFHIQDTPTYNPENMLLGEIIQFALDGKTSLAVLLRHCIVLGSKLKNEKLRTWANQELNGYQAKENLPEYRVAHIGARGHFTGAFGAGLQNYLIPPVCLEESHRELAHTVYLLESVSSYEHMINSKSDSEMILYEWPANFVAYYSRKIYQGYSLVHAWQQIPKSALVELLDTIRTRTLNMALEIQSELGSIEDLTSIPPATIAQVERSVTANIFGGTNIIASGQSQITASFNQTVIFVGDRAQLDEALKNAGLNDADLKELTEAEKADGEKKMGARVMEWIKKSASKAAIGGVKLGADITKEVLTAYLKQYMGMS